MQTYILNILEILKKYSDENNRLSQKEIEDLMEREYNIKIGRKAVKRNLLNLKDMGYDIEYEETTPRKNKDGSIRTNIDGEPETVCFDWYLNRDFTDAELILLIEGLLFSKYIPYSQCKELIEKLKGLSSVHFSERMKYLLAMPEKQPENKQLLYTIEQLDKAITAGKKVSFQFERYGMDKKRHISKNEDGTPREYKVSPYRMAVSNARYFLFCSHDTKGIYHYRLDSIRDINITDEPVRPFRELEGHGDRLNLSKYMSERVHMYTGEAVPVCLRTPKTMAGAVIDAFGMERTSFDKTPGDDTMMIVRVRANEQDMIYWALQYGKYVEVLRPESLRNKVREVIREIWDKYE